VWIAASLTLVPDLDFFLVWVLGLDRSWHRGFTHSVVFAICLGVLFLSMRAGSPRVCLAWTLALLSHGLLDWSTTLRGQGVELWWPLSLERSRWSGLHLFEFSLPDALLPYEAMLKLLQDAAVEAVFFVPLFLLSRTSLLRHNFPTGQAAHSRPESNRLGCFAAPAVRACTALVRGAPKARHKTAGFDEAT
jgi:membrane-bound metal-dependent hydrolase YbcI (DUF457 family)